MQAARSRIRRPVQAVGWRRPAGRWRSRSSRESKTRGSQSNVYAPPWPRATSQIPSSGLSGAAPSERQLPVAIQWATRRACTSSNLRARGPPACSSPTGITPSRAWIGSMRLRISSGRASAPRTSASTSAMWSGVCPCHMEWGEMTSWALSTETARGRPRRSAISNSGQGRSSRCTTLGCSPSRTRAMRRVCAAISTTTAESSTKAPVGRRGEAERRCRRGRFTGRLPGPTAPASGPAHPVARPRAADHPAGPASGGAGRARRAPR